MKTVETILDQENASSNLDSELHRMPTAYDTSLQENGTWSQKQKYILTDETEVDEGNDVYDIIEDLKREEISDDFKSIKMFNQLLKNIIDYRMNAFQQPMVLFHRYLSFLLIRYQRNNHQDMMMILLM
ncbi:hypothetical protein Avbf_05996 [Armadillidium vulgare]|nr:hypothetical protein Avbf_05996 [Armadillidium vulgare]